MQEYEGHEDELHASLRKIYGVDASHGLGEKAAPAEVRFPRTRQSSRRLG